MTAPGALLPDINTGEGSAMHKWCGCGAAIRARRSDVLAWRRDHRCTPSAEPTPGQYGGDSRVETNYQQTDFTDAIGFRPNEARRD